MQLNRTTDYALRLLVYLGQEKRIVPSSEIANSMKISQRYLLSVASKLIKRGFISAGMGPNGGYSLIMPLDQITLYDVIEYMEGTIIISRCLIQEEHCEERPCVLHGAYSFLQNIIEVFYGTYRSIC